MILAHFIAGIASYMLKDTNSAFAVTCFYVIKACQMSWWFLLASFLNQAHAWFLRIASIHECLYTCVFVCPPPGLLITSAVMWCDIHPNMIV